MVLKTSISVLRDDYLYIADEQQADISIGRSIVQLRSHPEVVIYGVTAGHAYLVLGEQVRMINAGEVVIVGTQLEHRWLKNLPGDQVAGHPEFIIMYFNQHAFFPIFEKVQAYHEIGKMLENSLSGLHISGENSSRIIEQIRKQRTKTGFSKVSGMLQLLHVISLVPVSPVLSGPNPHTAEVCCSDSFVPIIAMIHQNFLRPLTLSKVADAVGFNKNHVCRLFKRRMQTTFTRYRDKLRIEYAMELLKTTDHSIKYISHRCGYKSAAHFCYLFKLITGTTPLSIRENENKYLCI